MSARRDDWIFGGLAVAIMLAVLAAAVAVGTML